jgi:hypothetical protein
MALTVVYWYSVSYKLKTGVGLTIFVCRYSPTTRTRSLLRCCAVQSRTNHIVVKPAAAPIKSIDLHTCNVQ